jgi:membrane protein YdbS with pleckstrin-like domain
MNNAGGELRYRGRPSWLYFIELFVLGLLSLVGSIYLYSKTDTSKFIAVGIGMLIFFIVLAVILRIRFMYTIDSDSVVMRVGLIGIDSTTIQLGHISSIEVQQSPIEGVLGIGTVVLMSASKRDAAVYFKGIRSPHKMAAWISEL